MTLVYLTVAFVVGVWLGSVMAVPDEFLLLAASIPVVVAVLWWQERPVRLGAFCALFVLLGWGRFQLARPILDQSALATYNDQGRLTVQGVVTGEPDQRDTYTNLRVSVSRLKTPDDAAWREVHGDLLVRAPRYPAYTYGDELEIAGRIETPPDLADFSYREYLARQGIGSIIYRPRIELLGSGQGGLLYYLYAPLYALKARLQSTIEAILPEPQASLLAGILLGVRATIPPDLTAAFSATGTSHIVAISGFNIAIIAGVFASLAQRAVGQRWAWVFALAGIGLFTLMVGASAAVVRAAIMGGLTVMAGYFGRRSDAWASLAAAGLLMVGGDPFVLWDVGFQLSFLATLGLMVFSPPLVAGAQPWLKALFGEGPPGQWLTEIVSDSLLLTLAAQVTTLPVILVAFGNLSLVAPLTNLLILPAQPAIMLWGALATMAGLIFQPAGQVLGWVAWVFLTYTIEAVRLTARLPFAALNVGRLDAWVAVVYYAALAGGAVVMHNDPWRARLRGLWDRVRGRITIASLIGALVIVAILIWVAAATLPDGRLHVYFLDVGQGDAILVLTPTGGKVVVDGGPSPGAMTTHLGHHLPFYDHYLDLVVLTHPHDDHLVGLIECVERYGVGQVIDAGTPTSTANYVRWLELLGEKGTPVYQGRRGAIQPVDLGNGVTLTLLHPPPALLTGTASDTNNNSVVLRLVWGRVSFLFAGDIEEEGETVLLQAGAPLQSTVLKVPHHGSQTSLSVEFLAAVSPRLAVISCGADNEFGHPHVSTLDRLTGAGCMVLRTDQNGTVEVATDGEQMWVHAER